MNGHGWKAVFATILVAGVGAAWVANAQLASLETGQIALSEQVRTLGERVDRQDSRWTSAYDRFDSRLRDVELGER